MGIIQINLVQRVAAYYFAQINQHSLTFGTHAQQGLVLSCVPVCLSICLSLCPFVHLSVCLSVYLSVSLSICSSVCLSVCLFCLSLCLSVRLSVCLSACLCVCYYSNGHGICFNAQMYIALFQAFLFQLMDFG